ncbi:FAD-linked oxidase C-terminal domain-containing protein [Shinella sp. NM-101]|uniref:FAD-linked oxidase C-terminal domain-containing protein n=1 Tax=Shinella sp. NM-101 TaxID=2744455 RepID=UPI001F22A3F7|nr:FAD-linked oxidase C-terminal domain-containing protein [Shinella sp. NM-101]
MATTFTLSAGRHGEAPRPPYVRNPARHALALAIKATLDPKTLFNPGKVPYRAD